MSTHQKIIQGTTTVLLANGNNKENETVVLLNLKSVIQALAYEGTQQIFKKLKFYLKGVSTHDFVVQFLLVAPDRGVTLTSGTEGDDNQVASILQGATDGNFGYRVLKTVNCRLVGELKFLISTTLDLTKTFQKYLKEFVAKGDDELQALYLAAICYQEDDGITTELWHHYEMEWDVTDRPPLMLR